MFSQSCFSHIFESLVCLNDCVNCESVEVCASPVSRLPAHSIPTQCVPLLKSDLGNLKKTPAESPQAEQQLDDGQKIQQYSGVSNLTDKAFSVSNKAHSLSLCRFGQWISHKENQSVSGVCRVYRQIYISRTRISIHSVHSQVYMAEQYCPVCLWASEQIAHITTCQSVQPDKQAAQKVIWDNICVWAAKICE